MMEMNNIEDEENATSLSDNLKYFIESLLSQQNEEKNIENGKEKQNNNINIYKEFIDDKTIIINESNLKSFINELINQLNMGNNILVPFLDICPILIKSYIDSELDEKEELKYIEVFNLLKINSFISREYLFPIYEYFSDIFYVMNVIKEKDKKLTKFNKVFELWKIFYNFNINEKELKDFNSSSFCFMGGGGLKVNLPNEIQLNQSSLIIKIKLLNYNKMNNLNEKAILFGIKNNLKSETFFSEIEKEMEEKKGKIIILTFRLNEIIVEIKENEKSKIFFIKLSKGVATIKEFYLLKNFYGQIISLELMQTQLDSNKNEIVLVK